MHSNLTLPYLLECKDRKLLICFKGFLEIAHDKPIWMALQLFNPIVCNRIHARFFIYFCVTYIFSLAAESLEEACLDAA